MFEKMLKRIGGCDDETNRILSAKITKVLVIATAVSLGYLVIRAEISAMEERLEDNISDRILENLEKF